MTDLTEISRYSDALSAITAQLLAARLEVARIRKYDRRPAAMAALEQLLKAMDKPEMGARTYHAHESGERRPKLERVFIYSTLFEIPIDYLLLGREAEIYEPEARSLAKRAGVPLRIDILQGQTAPRRLALVENSEEKTNINSEAVNQEPARIELNASHNPSVRFITILSASEIVKLRTGRGVPAMSGPKLPVPDFLNAGRHSFGFRIPADDLSMVTQDGLSFNAGGVCVVDPERMIQPGNYVLAALKSHADPVIRRFIAAGPYSAYSAFELHALNPAFRPIVDADKKGACQFIGRIIFFGNEL